MRAPSRPLRKCTSQYTQSDRSSSADESLNPPWLDFFREVPPCAPLSPTLPVCVAGRTVRSGTCDSINTCCLMNTFAHRDATELANWLFEKLEAAGGRC